MSWKNMMSWKKQYKILGILINVMNMLDIFKRNDDIINKEKDNIEWIFIVLNAQSL